MNFEEEYWQRCYSDPDSMDGTGNASTHALYLKSALDLEFVEVKSFVDLGFGLGRLLEESLGIFKPRRAVAIEPSHFAYDKFMNRKISGAQDINVVFHQEDLLTWCKNIRKGETLFDLGICNSVFQYIPDDDLREIVPVLAKRMKHLYLAVPTDRELERIEKEHDFHDPWAIPRTRDFYFELLSPWFAFVSCRLLESKCHHDEEDTPFTNLLYRF